MDGEVFEYYCEHGEFPPEKPPEKKEDAPETDAPASFSVEEILSSETGKSAPGTTDSAPASPAAPDETPDGEPK